MNNSYSNSENLQKLIDIGIALSKEKNIDKLLEKILIEARKISNSDGGTLYLMIDDNTRLSYNIMHTESKNIYYGGTYDPVPESIYPVKLYKDGKPNMHNACVVCALKAETINIEDAYSDVNYDFSGTKGFDSKYDYHSKSFLNVPLINHKNTVIGVLQLLNAQDERNNIIPFSNDIVDLVESLASQASIALTNQLLIEEQKKLFKSFIQLVAEALEKKDKTTGGHCTRVPQITMMVADAINNDNTGKYLDFQFSEDEMEELYVAGWLHDFGKVSTPEYVMNKSTKLEGLYDKIEFVKLKLELLKKDKELDYYKEPNKNNKIKLQNDLDKINDDILFLENCNIGGETMDSRHIDRIQKISKQKITINNIEQNLLTEKEVEYLSISRGTLSYEDFEIMKKHVVLTYELLDKLPYPKHLKQVPFYAACHHEKLNGEGYPNGYSGDKLPLQARIIAIADVFEGLTAPDRPYKEGYKLSKAMNILRDMAVKNEIDVDLFNLFIKQKIYLKYANSSISESQIDSIDENKMLI